MAEILGVGCTHRPLMLRPIAYWQNFPPQGKVATIWGGGNPLLWWSALTAITITALAIRTIGERASNLYGMVGKLYGCAVIDETGDASRT